jgi:RNA polymerase sigma-70 factor (ECF subfamily)
MHTTPVTLLERLRQPAADEAWARFVRLYTPLLLHWAGQLGLQWSDAADLVQDVLTVLVRKLPEFQYDRDRSFRAWLRTVLLNKWREQRRRPTLPRAGATEPAVADLAGPDNGDAFGEAEYRRHLVRRAYQLIQVEFQAWTWKAFWGTVVAGKSAAEVARELGLNVGAVRVAKSRVLHRLREDLDGLLS